MLHKPNDQKPNSPPTTQPICSLTNQDIVIYQDRTCRTTSENSIGTVNNIITPTAYSAPKPNML